MQADSSTTSAVGESMAADLGTLLYAGEGAVVTLVAGETQLAAHRSVLAARSSVFEAMLQHDTLEASSGEVCITDVEGPVLRQLLAYCYSLRTPQMLSMAPQLLAAADKYGLSALKEACEQQVIAQLAIENAAAAAVLAVRHSCDSLAVAAVNFIKARNYKVLATQGWADAMRDHVEDVIAVTRLLAETSPQIRRLSPEERDSRLIEAAEKGDVEELRELLAAGADVRAREDLVRDYTALHAAARGGHVEAARWLLMAGAEVDARSSGQWTPLHLAAEYGREAVVRLLLAASADPNARGQWGWTPLHRAAWDGHVEAAAVLLEGGADRAATDVEGNTPLDRAWRKNKQQLTEILSQ